MQNSENMMSNVGKNSVRILRSIPRCREAVVSAGYHAKVRVCDAIFIWTRAKICCGADKVVNKVIIVAGNSLEFYII